MFFINLNHAPKCESIRLPPGACAALFHHSGCNGWVEPVSARDGYRPLSRSRKNEAESLSVRPGCKMVGYDHHSPFRHGRGKAVEFDATFASKQLSADLKGWSDLRKVRQLELISYFSSRIIFALSFRSEHLRGGLPLRQQGEEGGGRRAKGSPRRRRGA